MRLNTVAVFIGLIFWWYLWGIPGAILAVPIMATIKIACDHIAPLAPIGEFLAEEDPGLVNETKTRQLGRRDVCWRVERGGRGGNTVRGRLVTRAAVPRGLRWRGRLDAPAGAPCQPQSRHGPGQSRVSA